MSLMLGQPDLQTNNHNYNDFVEEKKSIETRKEGIHGVNHNMGKARRNKSKVESKEKRSGHETMQKMLSPANEGTSTLLESKISKERNELTARNYDELQNQTKLVSLNWRFRYIEICKFSISDPELKRESEIREKVYCSVKSRDFKEIERLIWTERVLSSQSIGQIILEILVLWDVAYNDQIQKTGQISENTKWKPFSEKRMDFLKRLFELLGHELNLNVKDHYGHTLLMYALHEKNLDVIQLLLDKGANIDEQSTDNGSTALMMAVKRNLNKCVDLLIAKKANLDMQDKLGKAAIMWSAEESDITRIEELLNKGADVMHVDNEGKNILMYLAETPHAELMKCILEKGIDVNAIDKDGNTALMYAAWANQKACIDELCFLKADPEIKNNKGESVKSISEKSENKNMWKHISFSLKPSKEDWISSFLKAIQDGDNSKLKALFESNESNEFSKNDFPELFGETTFTYALRNGNMDCAKILLENGYDVNDPGSYGKTPLEWAIGANDLDSIKFLLENSADANLNGKKYKRQKEEENQQKEGEKQVNIIRQRIGTDEGYDSLELDCYETPLWATLNLDSVNILELLLNHKADPNIENSFKQTPLIQTMMMKKYNFMEVLLKYKADPNRKDESGDTPLIIAAIDGDHEALELLLRHNADKDAKDSDGHTALYHAEDKKKQQCVEVLTNWKVTDDVTEYEAEKITDAFDDDDCDFLLSIPEVVSFGDEYSISSNTTVLKIKLDDHTEEEVKYKIKNRLEKKYVFEFETSRESELELGSWTRGYLGECSESKGTLGCFIKSKDGQVETYYALTNNRNRWLGICSSRGKRACPAR
ncbi:unnamed protein product [Owenia fusiformis]|uniref:Ankyrin repeat protein n=1 Tax=Owenia fusiformis TaxID=6347 RepID=A0A8S4MXG3_OWEFU|nr:unnamed protein product [Owenia fusiformis]